MKKTAFYQWEFNSPALYYDAKQVWRSDFPGMSWADFLEAIIGASSIGYITAGQNPSINRLLTICNELDLDPRNYFVLGTEPVATITHGE